MHEVTRCRVIAQMETPLVFGTLPTLDGIVASQLCALHGEAAVESMVTDLFARTDGISHASRGRLSAMPFTDTFSKVRRSLLPAELLAGGRFSAAATLPKLTTANANKAMLDERMLVTADGVEFDVTLAPGATGDDLHAVLATVPAIGAWRGKGFGRVAAWLVQEERGAGPHFGLLLDNGTPARPLPVSLHARLTSSPAPAYAVARAGTSYGYHLAPSELCAMPIGVLTPTAPSASSARPPTAPESPQGLLGRICGEREPQTWLNAAWPNVNADSAARPLTANSVLLLRTESALLAGNNLMDGTRLLPLLLSDEGQPSVFRTGRALLRTIIEQPPDGPYMVAWKDSNVGLSLVGASVGYGDTLSLVTSTGNYTVDAASLRTALGATVTLDFAGVRKLASLGDSLLRGAESLRPQEERRMFDQFEALGGADVFDLLPPRWSREWRLFEVVFGVTSLDDLAGRPRTGTETPA